MSHQHFSNISNTFAGAQSPASDRIFQHFVTRRSVSLVKCIERRVAYSRHLETANFERFSKARGITFCAHSALVVFLKYGADTRPEFHLYYTYTYVREPNYPFPSHTHTHTHTQTKRLVRLDPISELCTWQRTRYKALKNLRYRRYCRGSLSSRSREDYLYVYSVNNRTA